MKNMMYFEARWRHGSYAACAIVLALSLVLGLVIGRYRFVLPYIIPTGSATRLDGTTWTLFNQPWLLPVGPSASLTDTVVGLGIVFALTPVMFVSYNNQRYTKSVGRNIPRFLRDILESTGSGMILPKALIQASQSDYGPISREIGIAMTKFSLGYDFKASIMEACVKLRHPRMTQVGIIITEAYASGGKMGQVLYSSVTLFNGLEQHEEEKQSELRPYTQLVYISVAIFLVIVLIIVSQFIGPLSRLPTSQVGSTASIVSNSGSRFSVGLTKIPTVYFESIFFIAGLLESIFGGIVAGKIVDSSASAGLRHSIVLLTITIFVFNAPGVGIFATH